MLRRARMFFAPVWRAETYRRFVYVLTGAVLGVCCLVVPAPLALVAGSVWVFVLGLPSTVVVLGFSRTLRDHVPDARLVRRKEFFWCHPYLIP